MKFIKKLLLILVFIMPFMQGLYFYFEIFAVTLILLILLFVIIKMREDIYVDIRQLVFYGLFAFLNLISLIYAVDRGMALFGFLKMLSYCIFFLVIQQIINQTYKRQLLLSLISSGVIMATIGVLSFITGIGSNYMVQSNRLGGFFQYANTFGLFLLICLLLLFIQSYSYKITIPYGIILMMGIFLTMSRGTIFLLVVGMVGVLIIQKGSLWYQKVIIIGLGIILGVFVLNVVSADTASRLMVGATASEFHSRLLYYKDGIAMIFKHPLGTGHLGYFYIQKAYQSGSAYSVKYIHSNLLQMSLDIGVVGGMLFIGYGIFNLFISRVKLGYRLLFLLIMGHGLIDFDFQFGIIWFVLIILMAKETNEDSSLRILHMSRKMPLYITILLIGLLYISASFVTFLQYTNHSYEAITIYPYYTEAKITMLRDTSLDINQRLEYAYELEKNQPNIVDSFAYIRDYDYNNKDYEMAEIYARICMEKNPMSITQVEAYSRILIGTTKAYMAQGLYDEAIQIIAKVYEIPDYLKALELEKSTSLGVRHKVTFHMTRQLNQDYYEAVKLHQSMMNL